MLRILSCTNLDSLYTLLILQQFQDLVDDSESVLLVANEADLPFISKSLSAHGIANVSGYLEGGFEAWQKAEKEIDMLIGIEADEFAIDYNYDEFYLVDTRSATDYGDEHIEDSENISLPDLQQVLIDLEANGSYYVYATTAINAITAGSIFKKNGFARVRVITCDYETLKNSGLPLYKANKKQSSTQDKFSKN